MSKSQPVLVRSKNASAGHGIDTPRKHTNNTEFLVVTTLPKNRFDKKLRLCSPHHNNKTLVLRLLSLTFDN